MLSPGRHPGVLALALLAGLTVASCAPANERPQHGALPGSEAPAAPPGVPPTLTPSDALRFRSLPAPSPGVASGSVPSPSAVAVASPSAVAAPPIVRTIAPSANGHVPADAPVALSAVLVGRGADLETASLTVNGADARAQIDKRTAREWSIHTSQKLAAGTHTAKVFVRDASGAAGGFTWQFAVGDDPPNP
jgi:hypothetical protein